MPVKRLRISLGTLVAVEAAATEDGVALDAVESAFAAIAEIDRIMHPRAAGSDLARINDAPVNRPVPIHRSIVELLQLARRLNELTDGVFDPCLPARPGRLKDLTITPDTLTCRAPVELDFGGFAKGYAIDRAIDALRHAGCRSGLVNAGGDLRVFGPATDPIVIRDAHGLLTRVELENAALAVSNVDSRNRPDEHRGYYVRGQATHPDPGGSRHAAVIAGEAVIADALTKCALLCRKEVADRALREFGAARVGQ